MIENKNLLWHKKAEGEIGDVGPKGFCGQWRETLVLSGSFMSTYTAYLALQSLQSSINQEAGLGVVSLACLYASVILLGVFAPSIIRLTGAKWSLVVAWVCHCLYTSSNFYPTWWTLVPASILLGGIAGPQWTSQGLYITNSAERMAKVSGENLHAVLSKLNGVFFACYESTQITGNLISSLVFTQGSNANSTSVPAVCGADVCPGTGNATAIAAPQTQLVYTLLGIFLVCDALGLALTLFILPAFKAANPKAKDATQVGMRKTLASWFSALSDPKLLALVPYFVSCSMSQAVLFADFTQAFVSCSLGVSMVGFVMASHGATTSVVAIVTSRIAKYTGRYFLIGLACACNLAMLLTLLLWKPSGNEKAPYFIITAIWGVAVGIFHTQNNSLVGFLFPEKQASAFANYHTWNAIGYTIALGYGAVLCINIKLYVTISLVILGIIGYIIAEVIYSRETRALQNSRDAHNEADAETNILS